MGLRGALGRMLPRGRLLPLGGRLCRSRGFGTWSPTCYGGPRRSCTPTAEPAPLRKPSPAWGPREHPVLWGRRWRPGREAVKKHVPALRRQFALDLVVVNAENAAGGLGLTERLCGEFYDSEVDVLTTGNHVWDQREIIPYIDRDPRVLRPANFPERNPRRRVAAPTGRRAERPRRQSDGPAVHGRARRSVCPARRASRRIPLGVDAAAILVDFHAEASSEKMALGHFADGRVSAVFGSHCHVPTADNQIFPGGTAYQTDAGMCGDYDFVIGMQKGPAVLKIRHQDARRAPASRRGRSDVVRHPARDR